MIRVEAAAARDAARIATASAALGSRVTVDVLATLDRHASVALRRPGRHSANGSCRLERAADGWIAVNLPRDDDLDLVPAWTGDNDTQPWNAVRRHALRQTCARLVEEATLLGLAVSAVGECAAVETSMRRFGEARAIGRTPKVVDLSAIWAGPLCGALFAAAGFDVVKISDRRRPDPTRANDLGKRLNGGKRELVLDFSNQQDRARLETLVTGADVLITSSRRRALEAIGLSPAILFAKTPWLTWVAITAHGWDVGRIGFGDDAAAAGGLVRWTQGNEPRFVGDAVADPLTGLSAAALGMEAVLAGGGVLVDAALAQAAARAAAA